MPACPESDSSGEQAYHIARAGIWQSHACRLTRAYADSRLALRETGARWSAAFYQHGDSRRVAFAVDVSMRYRSDLTVLRRRMIKVKAV